MQGMPDLVEIGADLADEVVVGGDILPGRIRASAVQPRFFGPDASIADWTVGVVENLELRHAASILRGNPR